MSDVLVKVTAYKDHLVLTAVMKHPDRKTPEWVPFGEGNIGCVLIDSKKNLGVSKEALELLKKIPPGRDDIGDVDWWKCNDGKYAFSWLGSTHSVKHIKVNHELTGSRNYKVHEGQFQDIPNEPDPEAIAVIDTRLKKGKND
jgi:hypothetical protein